MIINTDSLKNFNKLYLKSEKLSYKQKLKLFDSFYKLAKTLGVLKKMDPWEGVERDIEIARILNKSQNL